MMGSLYESLKAEDHDVQTTFCRSGDKCSTCGLAERAHVWRCATCDGAFAMGAECMPVMFGTAIAHTQCEGRAFLYCPNQRHG